MAGGAHGRVAIDPRSIDQIDRWAQGFEHMDRDLVEHVLVEWQTASDVMYEYTQEFAHVLTGAMKADSDGAVVSVRHGSVEAEITYGPWRDETGAPTKPYALYEIGRGGDHDFMTRGFVAAERDFGDALPRAFHRYVESFT